MERGRISEEDEGLGLLLKGWSESWRDMASMTEDGTFTATETAAERLSQTEKHSVTPNNTNVNFEIEIYA